MKTRNYLSLTLALVLAQAAGIAQTEPPARPIQTPRLSPVPSPTVPPAQPGNDFASRLNSLIAKASPVDTSNLSRFSLDFPGGTPRELLAAIEKALGKPVNVIVPEDVADVKLPPVKVTDVTVPQLFQTLSEGSRNYSASGQIVSSFGFQTIDEPKTDQSIWTFRAYKDNRANRGLTRFDLNFPGGSPKDLVAAIQKAMGKPLNAIVPDQYADLKLPALKMDNVNVQQLFEALEAASRKSEAYITGTYFSSIPRSPQNSYQVSNTAYGFRTTGSVSDDSVWYFFYEKPALPPLHENKSCRFYLLTPYLESGLTVDDITTAIQSGWKMLGETETPAISFHKETGLLIAVGDPAKLEIIDSVLTTLAPRAGKTETRHSEKPDTAARTPPARQPKSDE